MSKISIKEESNSCWMFLSSTKVILWIYLKVIKVIESQPDYK